jgi:hypothetical protein
MYESNRRAVADGFCHLASYLEGLVEGEAPNVTVVKALLADGVTRATGILDDCYGED